MDRKIVEQFKVKYESLAGVVHLVADVSEVSGVVCAILKDIKASRIALGELSYGLAGALTENCENEGIDVLKPSYKTSELPQSIEQANAGITMAAFAIAETGTLVEFTLNDSSRLISSLPRVHIGLVRAQDLVETLNEAAAPIRDFYTQNQKDAVVTFISGPSRTGDIEMRLTLGVHGPETSHVIVIHSS